MDPRTLQFMIHVSKYVAPIADNFRMPSTFVQTGQNLGCTGVNSKIEFLSEAEFLSPLFKRARIGTAGSEERMAGGGSTEVELLLRDIQREQQVRVRPS